MNRHFLISVFWVSICIFSFLGCTTLQVKDKDSNTQLTTQEQAAEFASKLANEKCQKTFHRSPFAPDSYVAQLSDSRWSWGKIEPPGIHGFSAEIEFNMDGSGKKVRVVFHTDGAGRIVNRGPKK